MKQLELGQVLRPHGIRGELKLRLHFEQSTTLFEVSQVFLISPDGRQTTYEVLEARRTGKGVLLRLGGITTREAADTLRGAKVVVDRDLLEPLEPGEYYLADLVGCQVVGPSGPIGVVTEVQTHPTLDSIVIKTPSGKLLEQSLDDAWVDRVAVAEQLIVLASEDGLID